MTVIKWKKPSENGLTSAPIYNTPLSGLMENFFGDDFFTKEYASFVPSANVSEEADKFTLELSAPGFQKSDFKIALNNGTLIVSGTHKTSSETNDKKYSRKEFTYGSFQRSFVLPEDLNEEKIEAKYENGILNVTLPKNETKIKQVREISIS